MKELIFAAVVLVVLLQGAQASYCLEYTNSFWGGSYYTYIYCSYGCCGTSYSRYCCSSYGSGSGSDSGSGSSSYFTYTSNTFWSVGAIAGAAIGGFIGLCIVICIVVIVIKECNKSGNRVQTLPTSHYPRNNVNMVAMNTVSGGMPPPYAQPMHPPPAQPQHPPPYVGPGMHQPPASSAFPGP